MAAFATNAARLDGMDSTVFLDAVAQAADSDLLAGMGEA